MQCSRSSVSKTQTHTHTLDSTRLVSRLAHSQYTYIEIVVVIKCVYKIYAPRIYWRKLTKHIYWQLSNRQQGEREASAVIISVIVICVRLEDQQVRIAIALCLFYLSLSASLCTCVCVCVDLCLNVCVCVRILVVFIFCECIQPIESELQVKIEFDKRAHKKLEQFKIFAQK